jgi:hypothetical protein
LIVEGENLATAIEYVLYLCPVRASIRASDPRKHTEEANGQG